jgi:hypothetical protein
MNSKVIIRLLIMLNVIFWCVALLFPFSRFFSDREMRKLSYLFADLGMFFPLVLFIFIGMICWRNRRSLSFHKSDIGLALFAILADIFLISKV